MLFLTKECPLVHMEGMRVKKLPVHGSISRYESDKEQEFYRASKDLFTYYLLISKWEKLRLYSTEIWEVQP